MHHPAYRLSQHAQDRMTQRHINPWQMIRALSKRGRRTIYGGTERLIYHDPISAVTVIVAADAAVIVTVYRQGFYDDAHNIKCAQDNNHE